MVKQLLLCYLVLLTLKELRDSLNQLGCSCQTSQCFELTFPDEIAVCQGQQTPHHVPPLDDVFSIITEENVWNRINTWQRPSTPYRQLLTLKELRDSLNQLGCSCQTSQCFELTFPDEIAVCQGQQTPHHVPPLDDVFSIITEENVWNRINTWQRPSTPYRQFGPLHFLVNDVDLVQLAYQMDTMILPEDRKAMFVPNTRFRYLKDTYRGYHISVLEFTIDQNIREITCHVTHSGTQLQMERQKCAAGLCCIHKQTSFLNHSIIIVQKIAKNPNLVKQHISFRNTRHDTTWIEMKFPTPIRNDVRLFASSPMFWLTGSLECTINYNPNEEMFTTNVRTDVLTEAGFDFSKADIKGFFRSNTSGHDYIYDKTKKFNFIASGNQRVLKLYAIWKSGTSDGILNTEITLNVKKQSRVQPKISIKTSRDYFVFPETQEAPNLIKSRNISCNAPMTPFSPGNVVQVVCTIYSETIPTIAWHKERIDSTQELTGYDVRFNPLLDMTTVIITCYSVTNEDGGKYTLTSTTMDGSKTRTNSASFLVNVTN